MSMKSPLEELEIAVSRAIDHISELKSKSAATKPPLPSPGTEEALKELSEENRRLREERKSIRKRVRAIINEIDKAGW